MMTILFGLSAEQTAKCLTRLLLLIFVAMAEWHSLTDRIKKSFTLLWEATNHGAAIHNAGVEAYQVLDGGE